MTGVSADEKQIRSFYSGHAPRGHIVLTALVCIGVVLFFAVADVGSGAGDRGVLKGLKSVGVEVEELPRMAEKLGIKQESLKTEVVSRLRQAGIKIATDDDVAANPSLPFLKISLIIGYSKPTYIYAVVVGLNEKVSLERDPRIISYAMPWWRIVKGEHAGESAIAGYVRETLVYIINEFVANYNAVNSPTINPERESSQGGTGGDGPHTNSMPQGESGGIVK